MSANPYPALSDDVARVLRIFEKNPDTRIPKHILCTLTGKSERVVRDAITQLREQGHAIIAADESGYVLTTDPEAIKAFCAQQRSRATVILRGVAALEERAAEIKAPARQEALF